MLASAPRASCRAQNKQMVRPGPQARALSPAEPGMRRRRTRRLATWLRPERAANEPAPERAGQSVPQTRCDPHTTGGSAGGGREAAARSDLARGAGSWLNLTPTTRLHLAQRVMPADLEVLAADQVTIEPDRWDTGRGMSWGTVIHCTLDAVAKSTAQGDLEALSLRPLQAQGGPEGELEQVLETVHRAVRTDI